MIFHRDVEGLSQFPVREAGREINASELSHFAGIMYFDSAGADDGARLVGSGVIQED